MKTLLLSAVAVLAFAAGKAAADDQATQSQTQPKTTDQAKKAQREATQGTGSADANAPAAEPTQPKTSDQAKKTQHQASAHHKSQSQHHANAQAAQPTQPKTTDQAKKAQREATQGTGSSDAAPSGTSQ